MLPSLVGTLAEILPNEIFFFFFFLFAFVCLRVKLEMLTLITVFSDH